MEKVYTQSSEYLSIKSNSLNKIIDVTHNIEEERLLKISKCILNKFNLKKDSKIDLLIKFNPIPKSKDPYLLEKELIHYNGKSKLPWKYNLLTSDPLLLLLLPEREIEEVKTNLRTYGQGEFETVLKELHENSIFYF